MIKNIPSLKIHNTNTVKNTRKINFRGSVKNLKTGKKNLCKITSNNDRTSFNIPTYKFKDIMPEFIGSYTKEDWKKLTKLKNKYSKIPTEKLYEINMKLHTEHFDVLKGIFENFDIENTGSLILKKDYISKNEYNKIKKSILKIKTINRLLEEKMFIEPQYPLSHWFDTELGLERQKLKSNIYQHPVEKSIEITGGRLKNDLSDIKKYNKKYSNLSDKDLIKKKFEILKKLKEFLKIDADFENTLSNNDFKQMKKLTNKYLAINKILSQHNISTKSLESIIFSTPIDENIKKDDYIQNLGYVVNRIKIDNKDLIITFSRIENTYMFEMYNIKKLLKGQDFLKNLPTNLKIEDINNYNEKAKNIIEENEKSCISQIGFSTKNKKIARKLKQNDNNKNKDATNILNEKNNYYYIQNFYNKNPKEYKNAGLIIGTALLKFLKERNCYPLFLEAIPSYGHTHSPVSLYLKVGFSPFSHTKEVLLENMKKNQCEYKSQESVYFFLKSFEDNKKIIEKFTKIYNL